jgi:hypothetical protein
VSGLHTTNLDSIKLYSATGQLINVFDLNELINNGGSAVDHIQDGTYILSIIYDEQVIQRKIIIQ